MWNVDPAMQRVMPAETERASRRSPRQLADGRAYMDPRFDGVPSYVLAGGSGEADGRRAALVEDARFDHRAYLSRHAGDRRV